MIMATAADIEVDYYLTEEGQEPSYGHDIECPVCLLVLRDPRNSLCCRKNFCHACVMKIRRDGKPCPLCRCSDFKTQRNSWLSRELYQLQVYCGNRSKGCEWTGCLGEVETHLNRNPVTRYLGSGCQYVHVDCMFCSESYQRRLIRDHCDNCPQRPFSCDYCHRYHSCYEDVSKNHWPKCRFYPVLCPNKCGEYIPRKTLKEHIENDCLMQIVECEFKQFGCTEHLTRKEMALHMKYSTAGHESLKMMSSLLKQLRKQQKETHELEAKILEKNKNILKEQNNTYEKKLSDAKTKIGDMLNRVQEKTKLLEILEKRLNQRITQDEEANKRLISTCHRFERILRSREEYDEFIRFQIFGQGAIFHQRLMRLEVPLHQRLLHAINSSYGVLFIVIVISVFIFIIARYFSIKF